MKIRNLIYGDVFTFASLLQKLMDKIGSSKLAEMMSVRKETATEATAEEKEAQNKLLITLGGELLMTMAAYISDDVNVWFASLASCTKEELLAMPFSTGVEIVAQILEQPDVESFFTGVSRISKSAGTHGKLLKNLFAK